MRALTRRQLLGAAALAGAAVLSGCGPQGGRGHPWEGEPESTEGLWGFADMSGAWARPPRWHKARGSVGGLSLVQHGDPAGATEADPPLVGLLGRDGEMAFDPIAGDYGCALSQGAFAVDADWEGHSKALAYYGTDGRRLAPAGEETFEDACPFRPADALFGEPYAFARASEGGWGALSLDGSWLMAPSFRGEVMDRLYDEPNEAGLLVASASSGHFKGSWGVADASGSWVVGPRYDGMERFVAGHGGLFAAFEEGGLWGALAQDGSVAVPAAYGGVDRLADADLWLAEDPESGLWGTASPGDGSWVVEPRWDVGGDDRYPISLGGLGPGLVSVADPEGGLWGAADASTGEWAVAPSYSWLADLAPGLALARDPEGGLRGLVDASGSWALAPAFKDLGRPGDDGLVPARSAE